MNGIFVANLYNWCIKLYIRYKYIYILLLKIKKCLKNIPKKIMNIVVKINNVAHNNER